MQRAYVLLSGGIDSTTCLYVAKRDWPEVVGVSVFYGQRHSKETEFAAISCHKLGIDHRVVDLSAVVPKTMLTDAAQDVPNMSYSDIKGVSPTYVPFRNGLMLSAIASVIQGDRVKWEASVRAERTRLEREFARTGLVSDVLQLDEYRIRIKALFATEWGLYFGAHAEDAQNYAYPDCTPEFIGSMANAIYMGTYHQLRLVTPLEWLGKADIIRLGESVGVPWEDTWSCYKGEQLHCGVCPTCRARREGFTKAGVYDPTVYAQTADAA